MGVSLSDLFRFLFLEILTYSTHSARFQKTDVYLNTSECHIVIEMCRIIHYIAHTLSRQLMRVDYYLPRYSVDTNR